MSVKITILKESIKKCISLLESKDSIIGANWIGKVCCTRIKAQKMLSDNKTAEQRTSPAFMKEWNELARQDDVYMAKAKERGKLDLSSLTNEIACLGRELTDLKNELFFAELNENKKKSA